MTARIAGLALALLVATGSPASAQKASLERVDSLINAGEIVKARTQLGQWQRENPAAGGSARAIYTGARIEPDAATARTLYLTVALSHPTSEFAPAALLRLGQSLLTDGDHDRARAYLERLLNDYPTAPDRPVAYLWLTRAQIASGKLSDACTTTKRALASGMRDEQLIELVREEEQNACSPGTRAAVGDSSAKRSGTPARPPETKVQPPPTAQVQPPRTQTQTPVRPAPDTQATRRAAADSIARKAAADSAARAAADLAARKAAADSAARRAAADSVARKVTAPVDAQPKPQTAERPAPPVTPPAAKASTSTGASNTGGSFTVQSGAFRDPRGATSVARGLEKAGFETRIVQLDGSALSHVRSGRFATRTDAAALAARIKAAGFSAIVVDDVRREKK